MSHQQPQPPQHSVPLQHQQLVHQGRSSLTRRWWSGCSVPLQRTDCFTCNITFRLKLVGRSRLAPRVLILLAVSIRSSPFAALAAGRCGLWLWLGCRCRQLTCWAGRCSCRCLCCAPALCRLLSRDGFAQRLLTRTPAAFSWHAFVFLLRISSVGVPGAGGRPRGLPLPGRWQRWHGCGGCCCWNGAGGSPRGRRRTVRCILRLLCSCAPCRLCRLRGCWHSHNARHRNPANRPLQALGAPALTRLTTSLCTVPMVAPALLDSCLGQQQVCSLG